MGETSASRDGAGAVSAGLEARGEGVPAGAADAVVRELLDELVAADPVLGTALGLTEGAGRLPSLTAAGVAATCSRLHEYERRLQPLLADPDAEQAIDAFAGLQIVRRRLRAFETRRVAQRRPGVYLDAVGGIFPLLVREVGSTEERVEALRDRLAAVPELLAEGMQLLEPGLPAAAVTSGAEYADGLLDLVGSTATGFAASVGHEGAVDAESALAAEALAAFRDHLLGVLAASASPDCAAGPEVMADILRWEHVLDESPDALADYGREVLAETHAAMAELAAAQGYADAAAAVAAAQAATPTADTLVADYARAVAEARAYVVEHDVVTMPAGEELEVVATPAFLRSLLPFAAYDPPGPFAPRRLGFYYVTPPPDGLDEAALRDALRAHASASLATTGVHEAYPGHHLQLVAANDARTFARRVAALPDGNNILIEGWAFYCEELMEREGLLAAPAARLMRLNDQVWRSCRVVIDVELHLGRMGLDEAAAYLVREAHMNPREAELEVRRYAEEPGQAMSYLLGKREVLRLAATWDAARGGSRRDFHDELLSWGSLPPAVIAWGMGLAPRPEAARVSS